MTITTLFLSLGLGTIGIALLLGLFGNDRAFQSVLVRSPRRTRR